MIEGVSGTGRGFYASDGLDANECMAGQSPITRASSTGRRNTMQCIDSTMLARENHLFDCTRSKPSQSSVPAGLTLASDFGFCFQCQAGPSLVLRRPIEITRLIGSYAAKVSYSCKKNL